MFSFGNYDNNTLITNTLFSFNERPTKREDEEPIDIDALLEEQERGRRFSILRKGIKKEEIEEFSYKELLIICRNHKIKFKFKKRENIVSKIYEYFNQEDDNKIGTSRKQ